MEGNDVDEDDDGEEEVDYQDCHLRICYRMSGDDNMFFAKNEKQRNLFSIFEATMITKVGRVISIRYLKVGELGG